MKKLIIGVIVIFVFPIFALAYFQPATLTNGVKRIAVYTQEQAQNLFSKGFVLETKNKTEPDTDIGALPGPNINSRFLSVNGVTDYFTSITMKTSTTTICAIQSPAATSTLTFASADFKTSSSTASYLTFAKASTAYATTTIIGSLAAIGAGAQATILASSTAAQYNDIIFAPSKWLVFGMQGTAGTYSPTGKCKAVFRVTE